MINYFIALAISGFTILISVLILAFIISLIFIILKWSKANRIYKETGLWNTSPIKWALAYAYGAHEERLLARLGIRGELRNVAKYFYFPSTIASAYGLAILRKSEALQTSINKLKSDERIVKTLRFFEKSFDKKLKRFRINPVLPIKNSQISSHIDSFIIRTLADLFGDKNSTEDSVSIHQSSFPAPAREKLRKVNKKLANYVEQMRKSMKERVDYLVERLKNRKYYDPVHISEISSTTYLVKALDRKDLFTKKVISAINGYFDACIRPKTIDNKIIGSEIGEEPMGYSPDWTGEWACICATYLALLTYITLGILPDKKKDLSKGMDADLRKNMIGMIKNLLNKRWDKTNNAYIPKKGDPASIIPSNYSIGLFEWMESQGKKCKMKETDLQIDLFKNRYQKMIKKYYARCHVKNNGALVFSYIPGEKPNIFATRCALTIDLKIKGDHEWPFPKKDRAAIENEVLNYFYEDSDFPVGTQRNLKRIQFAHQTAP